jgi:adenosylcobinamide kinase/adenosylcobinamide-phosphate guanylyltransferase
VTGHTTLILGGARSGKSTWAEHLAAESSRPVLFVATAAAGDDEMAERIARHRAQRPARWRTVEEPVRLLHAVEMTAHRGETVVVDCLTLWVSNVILRAVGLGRDVDTVPADEWDTIETALVSEAQALLARARERNLDCILISNEVGMGVVPGTTLGRRYRDALGRVNQAVAGGAASVVLMVAGIPIDLRQLSASQTRRDGDGVAGS